MRTRLPMQALSASCPSERIFQEPMSISDRQARLGP